MENACGRALTTHLREELCMICLWINTFCVRFTVARYAFLAAPLNSVKSAAHTCIEFAGIVRRGGSGTGPQWPFSEPFPAYRDTQ